MNRSKKLPISIAELNQVINNLSSPYVSPPLKQNMKQPQSSCHIKIHRWRTEAGDLKFTAVTCLTTPIVCHIFHIYSGALRVLTYLMHPACF